jgi:glycosyltransferase involved in cell wall biosynthesis
MLPTDTIFRSYFSDQGNIADYYRAADLFCHASKVDVCPLTVLESQACGVPVVASRAGGIPEIINDGSSGVLVDIGDVAGLAKALLSLITNPQRRSEMGQYARGLVERKFTPEIQGNAYLSLFEQGLANQS